VKEERIMNDDFLHHLRAEPSPKFLATLRPAWIGKRSKGHRSAVLCFAL